MLCEFCVIVKVLDVVDTGIVNVDIVACIFKVWVKDEPEVTNIDPFDNNFIGDKPL